MQKFFIEGYGCSLNKADTMQIAAFLAENGFEQSSLEKANFAIINTCAVKQATEFKMLKRIRYLLAESKKHDFKIIVFGCLPEINPKEIEKISQNIIQIGPSLEKLAEFFFIQKKSFSPELREQKSLVAILPICRGCLGACSFCAVKKARGNLQSYSIASLKKKFSFLLDNGSKEIWLTAQDAGCYGKDIGTSLPELLTELLKDNRDFRLRIGMMNPNHLKQMLPRISKTLKDNRIYLFLHVPFQSGSNRILKLMNRNYKIEEFVSNVKRLRKTFPDLTLSTDIIVGFPSETEKDFEKTLFVLKKIVFDIVNVSRYGKRPFTIAAEIQNQVYEWEKKKRSRIASKLCSKLSLKRNKRLLGKTKTIFVNERGKNNSFVGRTGNYKPVAIRKDFFGKTTTVKISKAFPTYLLGEIKKQ
jgi:MiaB-like tRNA modifying enzyme